MSFWSEISRHIEAATGHPFSVETTQGIGGGCINSAWRVRGDGVGYFVKTNAAEKLEMFEAEAEGLMAIAATNTVQVPNPICWGVAAGQAYLVLEELALGGRGGGEALGRQLAAMHRHTAERFGWHRDNTIGSTQQPNGWDDDWIRFWQEKRLGFQLELAARNGASRALLSGGETLTTRLPELFADYRPEPSLLHGDLWGGNFAARRDGEPVIFDPATYYGDREADLAMTELFGGFSSAFYRAYEAAWPLDAGCSRRKTLYNLYHIINHFNLFGGGYLAQAEGMVRRLLQSI